MPDAYHGLLVELKDVREGVIDTVVSWVLHRVTVTNIFPNSVHVAQPE